MVNINLPGFFSHLRRVVRRLSKVFIVIDFSVMLYIQQKKIRLLKIGSLIKMQLIFFN